MTTAEYIQKAKKLYERDGEIEVDDNAKVSEGSDPGAYVQAWVWVPNPEAETEDGEPGDPPEPCQYCGCIEDEDGNCGCQGDETDEESDSENELSDLCDRCHRSGVEIARTDEDGEAVCVDCDKEDGEIPRYHENRAVRAEAALSAYTTAVGVSGQPLDLEHVRGLMQDLLHWIARHDPEGERIYGATAGLEEACERACADFRREMKEDQDE